MSTKPSFEQAPWHGNPCYGLHKKEFEDVHLDAVMDDLKDMPDVADLQERKADCIRRGDYLAAHQAKMDLKAQYGNECRLRAQGLDSRYKDNYIDFDIMQLRILENFEIKSEENLDDFDTKAILAFRSFSERQKEAHSKYMEEIRANVEPRKPRWSAEVLRLKKVQEILEKQEDFLQAHSRQKKVRQLEARERAQWETERNRKIQLLESHHLKKQKDEVTNFGKKIAAARQELATKHEKGLEGLELYKNNYASKIASKRKVTARRAQIQSDRVSSSRKVYDTSTSYDLTEALRGQKFKSELLPPLEVGCSDKDPHVVTFTPTVPSPSPCVLREQ